MLNFIIGFWLQMYGAFNTDWQIYYTELKVFVREASVTFILLIGLLAWQIIFDIGHGFL